MSFICIKAIFSSFLRCFINTLSLFNCDMGGYVIKIFLQLNAYFLHQPGPRCDECASGYYGDPSKIGGQCQPCRCSNNIDLSDPEACDKHTGQCLKCLYNTEGPDCGVCKSSYYGDASRRNCRSELTWVLHYFSTL